MTVSLMGGPLDGLILPGQPVSDNPGAYMIVPGSEHRAIYEPDPAPANTAIWRYRGDIG